ncbi:MAG: hypothetical protein M3065_17830 [Actinomycetota bacterium]|nr:hypothetical protein [Actinomycetota bacterium]
MIANRPRIDRFDLIVLAAFVGVSLWVLGLDLWQVIVGGRHWTGTDGVLPQDQMQYLAWIRAASQHGLASNLFVLRPTPADYFQPVIEASGGISALGIAPWLALLLWKPVAVGMAFLAIRAYVRRSLAGRWPRRAALVLALFFGFVGLAPDLYLPFWTWGYPFELIALAAMLGALLAYDRSSAEHRVSWIAPVLGALTSSLHPWQGETLILMVILAEGAMRTARTGPRRSPALAATTVIGTAIPLLYYAILDRVDVSWRLAQIASRGTASLPDIALALAPLAVPALLAYRRRPTTVIAAATRAWPPAALAVFLLSETQFGGTPLHAFAASSVPLSVLAVEGISVVGLASPTRRRSRALRGQRALVASLAVAAATLPATLHELQAAEKLARPTPEDANFIAGPEREALRYLAGDRQSGGVITRFYLGTIVPAQTGRRTFVGNCYWSQPNCPQRAEITAQLFQGSLAPRVARAFVVSSHARFVLSDCQTRANMVRLLGPIIRSVHRFGCASVYAVD